MQTAKEAPCFSNISQWQVHCQMRAAAGFPEPLTALQIAMPALYKNIADVTRQLGAPIPDMPQDSECVGAFRLPE